MIVKHIITRRSEYISEKQVANHLESFNLPAVINDIVLRVNFFQKLICQIITTIIKTLHVQRVVFL